MLFSAFSVVLNAQELIRGIINDYTPAYAYTCDNAIEVEDASAFSAGDKILIVQMKGAEINETNTASFGNVTDYGSAGKYEINEVAYTETGLLYLVYHIANAYSFSAHVQVVRIPVFTDVIIDSTLTCKAWDGFTGGILALIAEGEMILQADIDVSEKGFRGGAAEDYPDSCPFGLSWSGFRTGIDSGNGAIKGEGIAEVDDDMRAGRGKLTNGGGGGNDHNAGGGGGSMGGEGGVGGERVASFFSCPGPGVGQSGLLPDNSNSANRIYMGGGGGAGHGNNGNGAAGGNGGGIIFISVNTLDGNGYTLRSDGGSSATALGDGGGGGGAGGTLLLDIGSVSSDVVVELTGGNGSDITGDGCTGPGAGGGGGLIRHTNSTLPAGIFYDLSGGIAGTTITESSDCYGDNNGATDGEYGEVISDFPLLNDNVIFSYDFAVVTNDTVICAGNTIALEASGGINFNWSPETGLSASDIANPFCSAESTTTYTVEVTNLAGCVDTAIVVVEVITGADVFAGPDTSLCGPNQVQFFAGGGDTFEWSPSTGVSNIYISNPIVFVTTSTDYIVTVGNGVCSSTDTVSIEILSIPEVITNNDTTICNGETILLSASGALSYLWSPASSVPCADCSIMEVTPESSTTFSVTGTTAEGCSSTESFTVTVEICNAVEQIFAQQYFLFPNPATAFLTIQSNTIVKQETDFYLFSADSKAVMHTVFSPGESQYQISVEHIPPGIYLYIIQNAESLVKGTITIAE